MTGLVTALLVGVGGTAGAISRYVVGTRLAGPTATTVVNVLGSVAAGALVAADLPEPTLAIAAIGFCGAFTTFSSFAVEVADRLERGARVDAARYASVMLATALAGAVVGAAVVTGGAVLVG